MSPWFPILKCHVGESLKEKRALAFEAGSEFFGVGQDRIDGPELFLDSGLASSFGHALAAFSFPITVSFILFSTLKWVSKRYVLISTV